MCAQTLDGDNRLLARIAFREDERSPTLGYRNLRRRDTFLDTGNYPALSFDKYGLRTMGWPLHDKTELMPIFRHVCIRKQWLIGIFVCYEREKSVSKIHENEGKQYKYTGVVLMKSPLPRYAVGQLLRNIGRYN